MSEQEVDTRVTAYVFGELSPEETAAFERDLDQSRELEEEVIAIRETIHALESDFTAHASPLTDQQRAAIEQAIASRGSSMPTPPPPPVVRPNQSDPTSNQQLVIFAVVAASLMIVAGLMYPYVTSRDATAISMNQPAATGESIAVEEEVAELVTTFNDLIAERRLQEAEVVARKVAELQPETPISDVLLRSSRMAQQLSGNEAAEPTEMRADASKGAHPFGIEAINAETPLDLMADADESFPSTTGALGSGDVAIDPVAKPTSPDPSAMSRGSASAAAGAAAANEARMADITDAPAPNASTFNFRDEISAGEMMVEEYGAMPGSAGMDADADGVHDKRVKRGKRGGQPAAPGRPMEDMMAMGGMMEMEEMMDMDMNDMMGMDQMEAGMGMGGGGMGGGADMNLGVRDIDAFAPVELAMGDRFDPIEDNPFTDVRHSPLSTFSIDVDTASYAKVRSLLRQNILPRPDAVRIEEMLNYFDYDYAAPSDQHPFAASMEIADCPWQPQHRLARIGIKGKTIETDRPSSNLVFLLDVSGSMDEPNKLPLVIEGMKMLTDQLTENDKVAIVVYAGAAGLVLDATRGDKKEQIVGALDRLKAGGSTNGGQGILLAYELARDNFIVGGTNRVILCSDGDFNVGVTGTDQLVKIAQQNAKSNIFLSVLGFGTGNHNDSMMEQISNQGNGNYAFIDTKSEARKVLVEELGGTLVTIAKDVKIQIEFNPKEVASYRLIGYENRVLAAQDFNDDKKDAGEIGAGHTVTALYEIVPAEVDDADVPAVDDLRYQKRQRLSKQADSGELLVLKLRYKQPEGDTSTLIEVPIQDSGKRFAQTDRDFQFAASVACFGMLLRNSPHRGNATFANTLKMARDGARGDDFGYREEFVELVDIAKGLRGE